MEQLEVTPLAVVAPLLLAHVFASAKVRQTTTVTVAHLHDHTPTPIRVTARQTTTHFDLAPEAVTTILRQL